MLIVSVTSHHINCLVWQWFEFDKKPFVAFEFRFRAEWTLSIIIELPKPNRQCIRYFSDERKWTVVTGDAYGNHSARRCRMASFPLHSQTNQKIYSLLITRQFFGFCFPAKRICFSHNSLRTWLHYSASQKWPVHVQSISHSQIQTF